MVSYDELRLLNKIESPADLKGLSREELYELADEMRRYMVSVVSKNGGHLASNLGIVELTIALHLCFDFSKDRLVLDVGHQCYPHKMLT
ncbi:MAG: 1-deoxy-D-xylulose-5-phosphate synthase, partial [Clostridia bacterium]|nr:1-deoxy-D-xylulose-5-phosphate synthase [Clostridia bacterium]